MPGRATRVSLMALPPTSARASATTALTGIGGVIGTGRRPMIQYAMNTPTATTARVASVMTIGAIGGSGSSYGPTDGASQSASRLLIDRNAPAPTDPTARIIIGTVITSEDSCGW